MAAPRPATTPECSPDPAHLNYEEVRDYWARASPSVLGPYMMDGFGMPIAAGRFRFRGERRLVDRLTRDVPRDATVLDLGSGVGFWAEHFACRFGKVVAVEASPVLYEALERRCSRFSNVETHCADVSTFVPPRGIDLVFTGGLLMYLNEKEVKALFATLIDCLHPDAVVLCRESTVPRGTRLRNDDYHAVYRSVDTYLKLFEDCGLSEVRTTPNIPYIFAQMACEAMSKWKEAVPRGMRCLPVVGRLLYWTLRLGYPWNARFVPWACGRVAVSFPALTNNFFLLRALPPVDLGSRSALEERRHPSRRVLPRTLTAE